MIQVPENDNLHNHRFENLKANIIVPCEEIMVGPQIGKSSSLNMGQ
jgi:hypothetical protein